MSNKDKYTWLTSLLTGWGVKESWAKVLAGAIIGGLIAAGVLTATSCTVSYKQSAVGGIEYNYNGLTNQLTEMRFANAQCCCDTKQMFQSGLCDLRHLMDTYKCDTDNKIAASTATIIAQLNADKFERMQDKLDKANSVIAAQKAEADNQKQTAQILAALQQRGCAPASCSPCAPYGRGCEDPVCTLVNSLVTRWANAQEIPAVPAA